MTFCLIIVNRSNINPKKRWKRWLLCICTLARLFASDLLPSTLGPEWTNQMSRFWPVDVICTWFEVLLGPTQI